MQSLEEKILDISKKYYHYLLNLENVNGVGYGFKYINNVNTLQPCIHVLVEKKVESNNLTFNNRIPKVYMGIKTDVIEIGRMQSFLASPITKKFRPLEGGCCITIKDGYGDGTMGCIVVKGVISKDYFILTNNHVMSQHEKNPVKGTEIIQPSSSFGGTLNDTIAHVSDFIPIKFKTRFKNPINYADCGIAKIINKSLIFNKANKIINIGNIKGVNKPILNQTVKKTGFKTGLTSGYIKTIGVTQEIEFSKTETATFKNQIILNLKGAPGDSGAVVLNSNNEVIGLLFGGSEQMGQSIMTDINVVLKNLGVKIYTG